MNIKKKLGYFILICCMSGLCLLPAASVSAKETEQTVSANSQEISVSADTVEISDTSDLDADATIVYSGKDGALDWSIDSNGLLTISGTGDYTGKEFELGSSYSYKMTLPQWYEYKDAIKSAVVKVSGITSTNHMFYDCSNMISINVSGFDTSKVASMAYMFYGCSNLTSLDVSGFETSKVTNMDLMFSDCSGLTNLDVSGFNTSKVASMAYMFYKCRGLLSLDASGFNTSQVTDMSSMFSGCSSLSSLDVSGFDTSKVISMSFMFDGCSRLRNLTVFAHTKSAIVGLPVVTDCNWYDPSGNICTAVKQGVNTPVTYIRRKTLKASNTVISDIKAVSYTGSEIKPAITVSCGEEKLKAGTDYTVSYQNHVKAGTATLTINGKGYYMGSLQKTFTISPRQLGTGTNITLSAVGYYTGQKLQPTVVVTCNGRTLQANTDYTISYENNVNPGTASVVITGKGNYAGTVRKLFVIKCHLNKSKIDTLEFTYAAGNMKKLNSKMYFSLYMDFVPVQYATSYEIELSDEKGKVIKTYTVNCNNTDFVEKTFKKLPKDVYGVRIRGCRDGEYGEWSDKSIVVKQPKLQARNYKGAIQIKWQKLKGVSGYDIYMSRKQNSGYTKVASVNAKTTLKTIKKIGKKKLKKGTYYYYVVAKKKLGKKTFKSGINFKSYVKKK